MTDAEDANRLTLYNILKKNCMKTISSTDLLLYMMTVIGTGIASNGCETVCYVLYIFTLLMWYKSVYSINNLFTLVEFQEIIFRKVHSG